MQAEVAELGEGEAVQGVGQRLGPTGPSGPREGRGQGREELPQRVGHSPRQECVGDLLRLEKRTTEAHVVCDRGRQRQDGVRRSVLVDGLRRDHGAAHGGNPRLRGERQGHREGIAFPEVAIVSVGEPLPRSENLLADGKVGGVHHSLHEGLHVQVCDGSGEHLRVDPVVWVHRVAAGHERPAAGTEPPDLVRVLVEDHAAQRAILADVLGILEHFCHRLGQSVVEHGFELAIVDDVRQLRRRADESAARPFARGAQQHGGGDGVHRVAWEPLAEPIHDALQGPLAFGGAVVEAHDQVDVDPVLAHGAQAHRGGGAMDEGVVGEEAVRARDLGDVVAQQDAKKNPQLGVPARLGAQRARVRQGLARRRHQLAPPRRFHGSLVFRLHRD